MKGGHGSSHMASRITLEGRNISTLQYLLKLAHSDDINDQEKAAVELSKFVSGTVFPAVSFGPLAHALCRLIPSESNTIATYSARALKLLLLDDSLRNQALGAGLAEAVVGALERWGDAEDACACRELLGALQTLLWDPRAAPAAVGAGAARAALDLLGAQDAELRGLALAAAANLAAYADGPLLLEDGDAIEALREAVGPLLEAAVRDRGASRYYSVAALANASSHPLLADQIKRSRGVEILTQIEKECNDAKINLSVNKLAESIETALCNLHGQRTAASLKKYTTKWGQMSSIDLTLNLGKHRTLVQICAVVWLFLVFYLLIHMVTPQDHTGIVRAR